MLTEQITWIDTAQQLPDEDMSVLVYAPDANEPVWIGFLESGRWRDAAGWPICHPVKAWADIPKGPTNAINPVF